MIKLLSIVACIVFSAFYVNAQSLEGFKHRKTNNGVELYAKQNNYGVTFAIKNTRSKTVHVIIENVSAPWSDGRNRTKDVIISYVAPGKISKTSYSHADNYSKLTGVWSCSSWRWSEFDSDLKVWRQN